MSNSRGAKHAVSPEDLVPGDHVAVSRGGYSHHAIVTGVDEVVEFILKPDGDGPRKGFVREATIGRFSQGNPFIRIDYGERSLSRAESVRRAKAMVGPRKYNLFTGNCEHLAAELITGVPISEQVERAAASGATAVATATSTGLGLAGVGATGAVAGFGAAGLSSGLATLGLGGMAMGVTTVAALPVAAAVLGVRAALPDREHLTTGERAAREAGRTGVAVGSLGGAVGVQALVQAVGTASGAARIASGLRVVGSLVGGGMKAGVGLAAFGPALVGVGVGWVAYKFVKSKAQR